MFETTDMSTPSKARSFVRTKLMQANVANRKQILTKKEKEKMPKLTPEHFRKILSALKNNQDVYKEFKHPQNKKRIKAINIMVLLERIANSVKKNKK